MLVLCYIFGQEGFITNSKSDKPKLSSKQLITRMRDEKGILFNIISETAAEQYLRERNNYLRTAAYRKNYPKHLSGPNEGKYINLEFAYLTELSTLDMYLRQILFQMCIEVEHALKVSLSRMIEDNPSENGYDIVDSFLCSNPRVKSSIVYKLNSSFTSGLVNKYFSVSKDFQGHSIITAVDCPSWVLVELLSFGDFIQFYNYYCNTYSEPSPISYSIITPVRTLRNACGHNSCILLDMSPDKKQTNPGTLISKYVSGISGIGKRERQNKLACRPMFEICCLLYAESQYVTTSVKSHKMEALKTFVHGRLQSNMSYFQNNLLIMTTFDFLTKMVDGF